LLEPPAGHAGQLRGAPLVRGGLRRLLPTCPRAPPSSGCPTSCPTASWPVRLPPPAAARAGLAAPARPCSTLPLTRGVGCPYCAGQLPTPARNLAVLHPDLAAQWHPTGNDAPRPDALTPRTGRLVWWRCQPAHDWTATPPRPPPAAARPCRP